MKVQINENPIVLRAGFERWEKRQKGLKLDMGKGASGRYFSDVTRLAFNAYCAGRRAK